MLFVLVQSTQLFHRRLPPDLCHQNVNQPTTFWFHKFVWHVFGTTGPRFCNVYRSKTPKSVIGIELFFHWKLCFSESTGPYPSTVRSIMNLLFSWGFMVSVKHCWCNTSETWFARACNHKLQRLHFFIIRTHISEKWQSPTGLLLLKSQSTSPYSRNVIHFETLSLAYCRQNGCYVASHNLKSDMLWKNFKIVGIILQIEKIETIDR